MYLLQPAAKPAKLHVQLMGSGSILREVLAAVDLLKNDWGVTADVWSVPSFTEVTREAQDCERWNLLHPEAEARKPYVTQLLESRKGPAIAATDYIKAYADSIRAWVPMPYRVLGTDGYGRSDTRENLRHFFEVDRRWVTVAALKSLAEQKLIPAAKVAEAIAKYGINADKPNPTKV